MRIVGGLKQAHRFLNEELIEKALWGGVGEAAGRKRGGRKRFEALFALYSKSPFTPPDDEIHGGGGGGLGGGGVGKRRLRVLATRS